MTLFVICHKVCQSAPSEEYQDYDDYDPNDIPPDQARPLTGTQFISYNIQYTLN